MCSSDLDYMSNIDMNHYYDYDSARLEDMMEPYYTDYSDTFFTMQEEMDYALPMHTSVTTKLASPTHYGSCSIFKEDTTRSSHSPPPTARRRHNKATRKQGQATSLPRRRHEDIAIAHAQPSRHTKDIAKANSRKEGQAPSTPRWRNKTSVPPPMQEEAKPSKKAKPRHPNDFRRHPSHEERQRRQKMAAS